MSRIVIDARESGTSTGRYIDKLVEYLSKIPSEHNFIIITRPGRISYLNGVAPNFEIVPTKYKEFTYGEQLGFKGQLKALHPDLVHFTMVQQPILYRGKVVTSMLDLTTLRFRNPSKNPIVFTIKQFVYRFVNIYAARKSEHIITISEYAKRDIIKLTKIRPDKVSVTLNSADKITDSSHRVEGVGKFFIMYVGRPLPHKNLGRLIEAFGLLRAKHPELQLVLAGKKDSLYKKYEEETIKSGKEGIIFTDFIDEGQLRWLYEHTACYVVPSLSEGFGLPGLEAMAHGAPVASSNLTSLPEVYGDAAEYFNPLDIDDISRAVDRLLTDSEYVKELKLRQEKQVLKFSWKRMAEQTLEVYQNVLLNK